MRAAWRSLRQAPVKLGVIVLTWGTLLGGAYWLALRGFGFVYVNAGLGPFLLDRVWYLFLFVITVMLFMSQLATAYSTMVRSEETAYWMSLPLSARWIVRAKWLESSVYSAWAVLLLVMPLGCAYLTVLHQPRWLVGWLMGTLAPLVGIVTAWSTLLLLLWLRWVRVRLSIRREFLPFAFVLICGGLFWMLGERRQSQGEDVWFVALQELLPRMRVATSLWMPSSWMARAMSAALTQRWVEAALFAGLLWTTALVSIRLLDHVAAGLLFSVLRRQAVRDERPATARGRCPPLVVRRWMRHPFSACVMKDVLLFLRDPVQWSQGLVFFGLLGAYFANIDRLAHLSVEPSWRIGVASLNLACTLLVFGSLGVRFLFPQMSLEGRRLWLLHVVPGGLRQLLDSKLIFYGAMGLVITEGLLYLSATRLQIPVPIGWWLAGVGVCASLSLVGLVLGLGSLWLDMQATDPARIVSSSNGALALVLMLVYVGLVAWSLVVFWSGWIQGQPAALLLATAALVALSLLFGCVPVLRGRRALERFEA